MAKTLDAAEKLSLTNEDKEVVLFMRGAMFEKQKKLDQSEAEFKKVLAINPNSASALNYLGYMLADRNQRLNEALDMIKKALDQEPNNGAYLDSMGWALFKLGKYDDAAANLKRALDRTGKDPTIHDHLGDVYAKQGNWKEAIGQWEASIKMYHAAPPAEHDPQEIAKIQKKLDQAKVRVAKEQGGGKAR
jgi:tetratricopeptide (TPR) repeat protein